VTLDVQNRNTNAGVKYLEETRGNNQTDLFWASAPDAFEVLKGKGLLQKYEPKATGIPEKIGAFPINDPDGYYFGFAASGYGIMWNERYAKANDLPDPKEWSDLEPFRIRWKHIRRCGGSWHTRLRGCCGRGLRSGHGRPLCSALVPSASNASPWRKPARSG
jgi:hypothetical protein